MPLVLCGLLGLSVAFWGLSEDIGFIAQPFYAYAWWSYIVLLDGIAFLKRRSSLLTTRRRLLLPVLVWSVTFWFGFELLNLRYQNWYYVGVFARGSGADLILGPLFGIVSFATVFIGLFETYDALAALGLFSDLRIRPRRLPSWLPRAIQGFGILMVSLSLLCSRYLAPLVWGSVTYFLDPWNYNRGARSLLRDLEAGNIATPLRLLVAGLACGIVWESFNYFSPQKWIYTVRGLDELKLFEMPLLGFLGFPALALDAFSFFALVSYLMHGNRTWEHEDDVPELPAPRRSLSTGSFLATLPLHAALWGGVAFSMQGVNVGSVETKLGDLQSLPRTALRMLEELGIDRPGRLLRAIEDPDRRKQLSSSLGLSATELEGVREEVDLLLLKGIGPQHGHLLRELGIGTVEKLARADPDQLHRELARKRGEAWFPALRPEMVRVWVHAAREEAGAF
jgi:Domain of unknown function (DUF4332)